MMIKFAYIIRPKNCSFKKWLFLFFWAFLLCRAFSACPKVCQCKWRNGKQWVTCTDAKFIDIPRGLEPSTQVLNLDQNNLKILFTDAFLDRSLVNLQKVFLSNCKLIKLEKGSLRRLANLIEIDLSFNFLTSVPSEALEDVAGLRELLLKENKLTYLPMDAFQTTPDLVHLDVSSNNITHIHNQAFRSLTRLEVLKISGNSVTTVQVEMLKPLVALHGFHVHFNPWNCDCVLRSVRLYMLKRNVATSIPPKCQSPERLNGKQWKNLEMNEFVCSPEVQSINPMVFAANGENVSLACVVNNESEVDVSWQIGDILLPSETSNERYKIHELLIPEKHSFKKVSNLTIFKAGIEDEGTYKCLVENKAGKVETNVTLIVSEELIEEPLVAINEMFVAGAVFGALVFVLLAVILIGFVIYKKGRQFDRDRMKINSISKLQLPLKCSDGEDKKSPSMEMLSKQQYEYKSIPTSEFVDESALNQNCENSPKLCEAAKSEDILHKLDKPNVDIHVKNITTNIIPSKLEDSISYVEIPKATVSTVTQDQNPLLRNLAQQCRDEILRRKGMKRSRASAREKANQGQFPDLLDFPAEHQRLTATMPRRSSTSNDMKILENFDPFLHRRNPSLPSSPIHQAGHFVTEDFTPRRRHLTSESGARRQSLTLCSGEEFDLEFHAAQLEHFLQEYRNLQEQLFRMKASEEDELYIQDKGNTNRMHTKDDSARFSQFKENSELHIQDDEFYITLNKGSDPSFNGSEAPAATPSGVLDIQGDARSPLSKGLYFES